MDNFRQRIEGLDLSLFDKVHSQTSPNDKRSFLAIEAATGELTDGFTYLEIGSYLGGSLQPYVADGRCGRIFSIDLRPKESADDRGVSQIYHDNTTARMLENLRGVDGADLSKLTCIDADVKDIDPSRIDPAPELCLIDGEHTDEATWRDYKFCREVMASNGAIVFHDAMIIYNCLDRIVTELASEGVKFRAYNLPDVVFVVEIGDFPLHRSQSITDMLTNNHVGYLHSLKFTDQYRRFANRWPFTAIRQVKARFTGSNVTK
ncbi:MAG: class I SAM-dependent methyltransferase [Acidobacteria bacterium]|nr:class I SAM-dependent methyltransferase [Acidobacteriota bacterium]MCW5949793.1 class I SAM-dependent methyltransferase [Pyrinomonadaceae bacterium]